MGVIEICSGSSCLFKPQIKLNFTHLDRKNTCNWVSCMASTAPFNNVKEEQQRLTGDSFIRPHLRKLSPYQSILPFEVIYFRPV